MASPAAPRPARAFCQGGGNDGAACSADSDCPGAVCAGSSAAHAGTCTCSCSGHGLGAAAGAGNLACDVGFQVDVELPADGTCDDANAYSLPPVCSAMTSTTAVGQLDDANLSPGKKLPSVLPSTVAGAGIDCYALAASSTSGLTLVGHTAWFDTGLGDYFSANRFECE